MTLKQVRPSSGTTVYPHLAYHYVWLTMKWNEIVAKTPLSQRMCVACYYFIIH